MVADLVTGATLEARLAHLRAEGLADESGLGWLLDQAQELVHDDPSLAEELAALCDAAAAGLDLAALSARSCYLRGRIYAERGEFAQALDFIERARQGWADAGQHLAALRSDLGRMQVLDDLGRHEETAEVGAALLAALDQLPDQDGRPVRQLRAMAQNNLGATYSQVGEHGRALEAYALAEAGYRALGMRADTAQPLANRGICLLAAGRPRDALEALAAAADIFAETGDRLWAAKVAGVIAGAHQQLGELVDALRELEPARTTLDELGAHAEAARIQLATAEVYLAAGLFAEAVSAAEAAAGRTGAQGMVHDQAVATFTLAQAHLEAADLSAASRTLEEAATLFDQVGDRQYRARVMLSQAGLAERRGQPAAALAWADAAAADLEAGGWLIPLAWAKLRQADLAPAPRAGALLAGSAGLIERLSLPELRYAYQLRLGRRHRLDGEVTRAAAQLRDAITTAEQVSSSLPDPVLRAAFRAAKPDAHDELLDLLVARGGPGDLAEACQVSDRAKAQTLIELATATVGARRLRATPADTDQDLEQRGDDLSAVYGAMATARPADAERLRQRAGELEQQISVLRLRRSLGLPAAATGPAAPGDPMVDPPSAPVLAYHVVGDSVVVFVVHGGQVRARHLAGIMPDVAVELDRLVAQWSRFRMGAAFTARHQAALLATADDSLATLYRLLIAPVANLLTGSGPELVIVPHRRLHQVPFHALHDGTGYLCHRYAITLMPSSLRTRAAAGPPRPPGASPLVLAVPDAQAPSIAAEARSLARVMPDARIAAGAQATSKLLREQLPGPAIVHLACHGLYRPANPLFSALRLADRWINAADILGLDLGGALVTLSACESGRPSDDTAEPVGLAWAFLAAGASGVIVSQWLVDDDATARLMSALYAGLATGLGPAEALRQAQLSIAESSPHPYRWAPFVYVASPSVHQPQAAGR
jgi:CHAT domain-containing protein/tetratricopeptide (TPR) repeat protein